MRLDLEKLRENVLEASTEDLLDRATIYRAGMEPEALAIIDEELRARGVSAADAADHAEQARRGALVGDDGIAVKCQNCPRPAVAYAWRWQRLWGLLPLFPRRVPLC